MAAAHGAPGSRKLAAAPGGGYRDIPVRDFLTRLASANAIRFGTPNRISADRRRKTTVKRSLLAAAIFGG
jgi:hypothetical protein